MEQSYEEVSKSDLNYEGTKFDFTTKQEDSNEGSNFEPSFNEVTNSEDTTFIHEIKSSPEQANTTFADELDAEERLKRSQERLMKLNHLTSKLKSPSSISDLEDEPAYIRKKVKLDNVEHSSENKTSRFTLGDDGDNNPEIRPNNSFLHDNVD